MDNPRILLYKSSLELRDSVKCGICLGPLSESVTLHCHHSFCSNCIQHAISIKAVCPLCSVTVVKRNIAPSSARNGRIIQAVDEFVNAITSRSRYTTDEWQILHPAPPSQLRDVSTSHGNAVSSSSTDSSIEAAQEQRQSPPLEIAKDESHEESASAAPAPATETQLQGVREIAGDIALPDGEKEQRMSLSHDRNETGKQKQDDERIKANGSTDDEDMSGDVMDFDQDHIDMNVDGGGDGGGGVGGGGGGGGGGGSSSSGIRGDHDSHPASEPGEQPMIHEDPQQPAVHAESPIAAAGANASADASAGAAVAASADSTASDVDQNEVIGAQRGVRKEGEGEEEKGGGNRGEEKGEVIEEEKGEEKEEEMGEEKEEEKARGQGMEEKGEEEECGEKEMEKEEQKKREMKKREEAEEKMRDEQMGEEVEDEEEGKDNHQSPPPPLMFHQGDEVDVLPRCWIGSYAPQPTIPSL